MVKKQYSIKPATPSELRQLAEERVQQKKLSIPDLSTSHDTLIRMVHELEVHQIELEMLNEALMLSGNELVISRKKMADSLERYTELYDFAPVGYLSLAPDGRILKANLMASSILGIVRSQLLNNHLQNFFIPHSLSLFKVLLDAVFIQKKRGSCELMLLALNTQHPQDQYNPSAHTVRLDAVVNDNGQECRVILSDISKQKQTEEALRKSKERYEATIDAAQIGTWDWNVQTGEVIFNNRWFEIVGYSPEELAPESIQTWIDLLHPDDLKASREIAKKHFNGESEHFVCECRMKHKNGNWVWVLDRGKLLSRTPDGKPLRMLGTHSDITQRKLAIEQLKKMSAAVEQSPAVVVITDAQGTIEYVNPLFTELTGYNAEEVKGKNPQILQSGLTPKSVYDELWKTIVSGNIWHGEWQNKKKNGELFWESVVISAIQNPEGVITNFVAVKEDITRQKKMVSELIAAKEHAEESDRLKSAFLANISHEIRTPMNGILGFSELLKEPHLTGEEQAEYVDLIQQSGQRMLNLINDLIDISRIEAGETKLQITPTPVNKVLRDLHAFFMPAVSINNLQLHCAPGLSDTESIIETDNGKLVQILTNLLQNALKFTRTGTIDFGYTRQGTALQFYVTDTGIGISDEMQEKIFDRFRQVDNTLTRNHEGSGLGLSISKAYAAMLGGKLSVQSVEGIGSTFTFTLPYNPVNSPIPSTQPNSSI